MQDIQIPIFEREGQEIIKLSDLIVFLSHRKEEQEKMFNVAQADNTKNLITKSFIGGEIEFIKELLKKPDYIFKNNFGCWTCGQHFKTKDEIDEHNKEKNERGICPP